MKNDGGPAFPKQPTYRMPAGVEMVIEQGGMSLRDYFAAAALKSWIVRALDSETMAEDLARWAYKHADAMLAEREKP